MARKNYGPISKAVKNLCAQLCLNRGAEAEFKEGLRKIVNTGVSFYAIGSSLQKWSKELCVDKIDLLWKLVDEVDTRIRKDWEKSRDSW